MSRVLGSMEIHAIDRQVGYHINVFAPNAMIGQTFFFGPDF